MAYKAAASRLRKNIQIMTNTFEKNNLHVLNVGCKPYDDDDADLQVYVELESMDGESIPSNLYVKINLYDDEGNLYMIEDSLITASKFDGYDTIEINCYDSSHVLEIAKSGRLYVVK